MIKWFSICSSGGVDHDLMWLGIYALWFVLLYLTDYSCFFQLDAYYMGRGFESVYSR